MLHTCNKSLRTEKIKKLSPYIISDHSYGWIQASPATEHAQSKQSVV